MTQDLKSLPKSKKKVVSKVLEDSGFTLSQIGTLLGVSPPTAMRYADGEVPDSLKEFEMKIKEAFTMKEQMIAAKALARMDEAMARARISEALDVYKVMMGKDSKNQTNVQVNVTPILGDKKAE